MRKLFSLLALMLSVLAARAASDGINAMLLEGPSDFRLTILLDDQPVVTFSDDYLVVTTYMGDGEVLGDDVPVTCRRTCRYRPDG